MPLTSTIGERTALDSNDPALSRRSLTDWIAKAIGPQFARRADVKAFVDQGGCVQLAVAMQPLSEDSPPCLLELDDCDCFACAGWPQPVVIARVRATSIDGAKAEALQLVEAEAALATLDGQGFLRWAERRRRT